jgi:hypothetical protein
MARPRSRASIERLGKRDAAGAELFLSDRRAGDASVYLGLQMDRRALRSLPAQAPSPAAPDPPNGQGPFTGRAVRLSVRGAIKRGESCRNRDAARLPCTRTEASTLFVPLRNTGSGEVTVVVSYRSGPSRMNDWGVTR